MKSNEAADPMLTPAAIHKFADLYLGAANRKAPLASPLFADLSGLPPVHVVVGDTEILLSDSEVLVEKLKQAGVSATLDVWPGMMHVFPLLASIIPESRDAIRDIGDFLRPQLGTGEAAD